MTRKMKNKQSALTSNKKSEMTLGKILLLAWQPFFLLIASEVILQLISIIHSFNIRDIFDAAVAGNKEILIAKAPIFIILACGLFPFNIWLAYIRAIFVKKSSTILKQRYLKRAFDKNINEFQSSGNSRYINDITNNANTLEEKYFQQMTVVIMSVTAFFGSLALIISINWQTLTFIIPCLGILLLIMYKSGNLLKKPEQKKAGFLEEYTRYAKETLSAFRIVKSFQLEKRILKDFDQRSTDVQDKGYEIEKRGTYLQAMNQLMSSGVALFGLLIGVRAVAKGTISVGVLFVLIIAISNLIHPIFMLSEALPHLRSVEPIFQKMEQHLQNQQMQEINKPYPGLEHQISLTDISFDYPDIPVLNNADAKFKKGGKYLIIGPSGSGKSTILRLLRKYFNPDHGQIMIDDTQLNEINTDSYYQKLSNIEQNVFIFNDTIRNNITLFQDVSDEKLNSAITAAGLDNLLNSRTNGLDDVLVNNGAELSGGEKTRIAIARGLLAEADIMLLDEPFASLDDETAQKIEQRLLDLTGVTILNVSHVVFNSTKNLYDDILLVKDGQIYAKTEESSLRSDKR
ncbi:MAG TPA: ABC transporter ATP-binding protein [Clostridiaceae bacterium]|nr:ABC transporter ATP-binding protein [Clostridiaceae bacterium]